MNRYYWDPHFASSITRDSLTWENVSEFLQKRLDIDRAALLTSLPKEAILIAIRSMADYNTLDDFLGSLLAYCFSDPLLTALETAMTRQAAFSTAFASFVPLLKQLVEFISYLLGVDAPSVASYAQFKAMGLARATGVLYQPRPELDQKAVQDERAQLTAVLEIFLNYVETVGPNMVSVLHSLFSTLGDEAKFHWFVQEFNLGASGGSAQGDSNLEFITMLGRFVMGNIPKHLFHRWKPR